MPANQCPDCGSVFPNAAFAEDGKCGDCANEGQSGPMCKGCAKSFPKLRNEMCGVCSAPGQDADASAIPPSAPLPIDQALNPVAQPPPQFSLLNSMNTAMLNVPNPRAASQQSKSTQPRSGQWSAAHTTSAAILGAMHHLHSEATLRQAIAGGPAPAPIPVPAQNAAVSAGNVFITVHDLFVNGTRYRQFSPYTGTFPGNNTFSSVIDAVRVHVDAQCQKFISPPIRVYNSEDVELRFKHSRVPPLPDSLGGSVWDLLTRHRGMPNCYMPAKIGPGNNRGSAMDFIVHVTHIERTDEEVVQTRSLKRKASSQFPTRVNTHIIRSPSPVITEKSLCQTFLEVRDSQDDDEYSYVAIEKTRPGYFTVKIFEDLIIGKGETKEVIKMLVTKADDTVDYFAAKQYTKGAKEDEDEEEANIRLCREEMQRTMVAKQITETFCKEARKKNVAIHDLKFLTPVIMHENPDLNDGFGAAWLCDNLIPGTVIKYSGTDDAGSHPIQNFVGRTCDALAHFSLSVSDDKKVLVDLQGIIHNKPGKAPKLKMFDVQMHTIGKDSGMGDAGPDGIQAFKEQHVCNKICTDLGLKALD